MKGKELPVIATDTYRSIAITVLHLLGFVHQAMCQTRSGSVSTSTLSSTFTSLPDGVGQIELESLLRRATNKHKQGTISPVQRPAGCYRSSHPQTPTAPAPAGLPLSS